MTKVMPAFCLLSMSLVAACSGAAAKSAAAPGPKDPAVAGRGAAAAVAGVYELDKPSFASYLATQGTLAKGRELEGILIAAALAHEIEWTFDLRADGSVVRMVKTPFPSDTPLEPANGTWLLDGSRLSIRTIDPSGDEETVSVDYTGGAFTMELTSESGRKTRLTFKKK